MDVTKHPVFLPTCMASVYSQKEGQSWKTMTMLQKPQIATVQFVSILLLTEKM